MNWRGCYDGGWADLIVPEAFQHPAKYSRALIARIYDHCREQGWLQPGDVVLDPFGGVALGALDAMRLGLNWVGCELEPKFCRLGNSCDCDGYDPGTWETAQYLGVRPDWLCPSCEGKVLIRPRQSDADRKQPEAVREVPAHRYEGNLELWNRRFAHVPGWGTARLVQGDSRRLGEVVAGAGLCLSSPPYAQHVQGADNGIDFSKLNDGGKRRTASRDRLGCGFGEAPGQLGNLPATPRGLAMALSSPPYAESMNSDKHGIDLDKVYDNMVKKHGRSGTQKDREKQSGLRDKRLCAGSYGTSPGQLGAMPPGDPAAVISSPPYADDRGHPSLGQIQDGGSGDILGRCSTGVQAGDDRYGKMVGQLAAADFWSASRVILEQVYAVLKPGGHAIFVTKDFVRKGQRVPFSDQWQALCEAVGFVPVCRHRAMLVTDQGEQRDAFGQHKPLRRERKSFFRRLAESKGSPRIDAEDVRCYKKVLDK